MAGREVVREGEDPARRALEEVARSGNGIDHEVIIERRRAALKFDWPSRSASFEVEQEIARIQPSSAPRAYHCGSCGQEGHNTRTCPSA